MVKTWSEEACPNFPVVPVNLIYLVQPSCTGGAPRSVASQAFFWLTALCAEAVLPPAAGNHSESPPLTSLWSTAPAASRGAAVLLSCSAPRGSSGKCSSARAAQKPLAQLDSWRVPAPDSDQLPEVVRLRVNSAFHSCFILSETHVLHFATQKLLREQCYCSNLSCSYRAREFVPFASVSFFFFSSPPPPPFFFLKLLCFLYHKSIV